MGGMIIIKFELKKKKKKKKKTRRRDEDGRREARPRTKKKKREENKKKKGMRKTGEEDMQKQCFKRGETLLVCDRLNNAFSCFSPCLCCGTSP
jgi:hypothetical protein